GSASAQISGEDAVDQLCVTGFQRLPALPVAGERCERAGRELFLESRKVGAPRCQLQRKLLKAWVVPDDHDRRDGIGDRTELPNELRAGGSVQSRLELDGAAPAQRRLDRLECPAGANRRRAENERGPDPPFPHVPGDFLRGPLTSWRERTVDVWERRIRPARLCMPQQEDGPHPPTVPAGTGRRQARARSPFP